MIEKILTCSDKMSKEYCCTVVQLGEIQEIPGANTVAKTLVNGRTIVIGKEHKEGVAIDREHLLYEVLLLGGHAHNSLAASVLNRIGIGGQALDVSAVRKCDYTFMTLDKILKVDLLLGIDYLGAALVCELALYLKHLGLNYLFYLIDIGEDTAKLCDKRVESLELLLDLLSFHTRQLTESHLDYRLCLNLGQSKAFHQPCS